MVTRMRLPPVDEYRAPLVEPLGRVALHAARLDNALIEFIALLLPFRTGTTTARVAHELRNWNPDFLFRAIDRVVTIPGLTSDLHDFVRHLGDLRERRHRVIHDAMEV